MVQQVLRPTARRPLTLADAVCNFSHRTTGNMVILRYVSDVRTCAGVFLPGYCLFCGVYGKRKRPESESVGYGCDNDCGHTVKLRQHPHGYVNLPFFSRPEEVALGNVDYQSGRDYCGCRAIIEAIAFGLSGVDVEYEIEGSGRVVAE